MNIQQLQFNRQWVIALLLAGLIVALAAGLAWTGAEASGSTVQPANIVQQSGAYALRLGQTGLSAAYVVCSRADFLERESGLLSWSQLRAVKGGKVGGGMDRADSVGCESGLSSWSQLGAVKGSKLGIAPD